MEYKKIKVKSYNLHLIKTNKFKTILFKFVFRDEIKKEDITKRNLLLQLLTTSSILYPTKRLINIKKQELYDLSLYSFNRRIGNHMASEIYFNALDPKYTQINNLNEVISFIKEIIFNPNILNNSFNEEMFNINKNIIQENILSIKNYPSYLAALNARKAIDDKKSFSYNMDGYIEDLNEITPSNLYEYYKKFLNNSLIDIYIIGNIDFYEMEKLVKENIKFKTIKKLKTPIVSDYISKRKRIKEVIDTSNNFYKQSRLVMGLSFNKLTDIEKKYTLILYNMILGNSPSSKLFLNIRENKSLAYDISSIYNKNDNIMLITTGIELKKYKEVVKEIKKELKNMAKGNFTEEELDNSKITIKGLLNEFEDFPKSIAEYYFSMDYLNIDEIEKAISIIEKITKEDIIKVANKVKIDVIYLLSEGNL